MDDSKKKMSHIAKAVAQGRYRYTIHAAQEQIARRIKRKDIEEAIIGGEIIEDYPEHHYGPACLIFGWTIKGKIIHVVCSLNPIVDLITVYEPDPSEWDIDFKTRRKKL